MLTSLVRLGRSSAARFSRDGMKYILVTGGVISGVGKGIIASSLGVILKEHGFRVSAIKIDPYINIDAGTFSPYEHGEVFVLDDGGEVDLDLGNYERFMGIRLKRDNNITTGKIYKEVIDKERQGAFLGKTVQVVPHITDAIQDWTTRVAMVPVDGTKHRPDVCIIELGGTIGDIEGMPFVEAFRQFQFRVKKENFLNVHVSLIPEPRSTGEQKTKPTQNSVRELRGLGLAPDLIICRSETPIEESVKQKISNFCHVAPHQVICVHDVSNIYRVPLLLDKQGVVKCLLERLEMKSRRSRSPMTNWRQLAETVDNAPEEVQIALVGKYVKSLDAYTSVIKALRHAAIKANRRLKIQYIDAQSLEETERLENPAKYHEMWGKLSQSQIHGVLVPGGFGERGIEGKIAACNWARTRNVPFLGVCLGMQCATVEFARNVLKKSDANSTEFKKDLSEDNQIIVDMPEHHHSKGMGGTMRLGRRTTVFLTDESKLKKLYGDKWTVEERHRHRYEVNPRVVKEMSSHGFEFVGMGPDEGEQEDGDPIPEDESLIRMATQGNPEKLADAIEKKLDQLKVGINGTSSSQVPVRMEIFELKDHKYYVGVQFHPEYLSTPLHPSAPYLGLILAASGQLDEWLFDAAAHARPSLASSSSESLSDSKDHSVCPNCKSAVTGTRIPASPYENLPPRLSTPEIITNGHHTPVEDVQDDQVQL